MTTQKDAVKLITENPEIISENLSLAGIGESSDELFTTVKLNDNFGRTVYVLVHYSSLTDELAGMAIRKAGSLLRKDRKTAKVIVVFKIISNSYKEALNDSKIEWIELADEKIAKHRKRAGKNSEHVPDKISDPGEHGREEGSLKEEAVNDKIRAFCEWLLSKDLNASWREFTLLVSDQIETRGSTGTALPGKQRHFQLYRNQFLAYEGKIITENIQQGNTDTYFPFLTLHLGNQTEPGEEFTVDEQTKGVSVQLNHFVDTNTGEIKIRDNSWRTCLPEQAVKKIAMIMKRWGLGEEITFPADPGDEDSSLKWMIKQLVSLSLLIKAAKGKVSYVIK